MTDPDVDLRAQVPPDHPLKPFVDIVYAYERKVFKGYQPPDIRFRDLLRYRRDLPAAPLSTQRVQRTTQRTTPETHDHVCIYISALCLIETWGLLDSWWANNRVGYIPRPLAVQKSLTQAMLEDRNRKLSYWDKIANLPSTLARISGSVKAVERRMYTGTLPVLRHLLDLAVGEAKSDRDFVVENFRVAAWNLCFIFTPHLWSEEEDSPNPGQMIPDLPRNWDSLIVSLARMEKMQEADLDTIIRFLDTKGTAGRIRVILQLVLMISPVYLLAPASLRGAGSITKQKIYEVCYVDDLWRMVLIEDAQQMAQALGSPRPYYLVQLEREIWKSLSEIVVQQHMVEDVVTRLLSSPAWKDMEFLDPRDPSAYFFQPVLPHVPPPALSSQSREDPAMGSDADADGDEDNEEEHRVAKEIQMSGQVDEEVVLKGPVHKSAEEEEQVDQGAPAPEKIAVESTDVAVPEKTGHIHIDEEGARRQLEPSAGREDATMNDKTVVDDGQGDKENRSVDVEENQATHGTDEDEASTTQATNNDALPLDKNMEDKEMRTDEGDDTGDEVKTPDDKIVEDKMVEEEDEEDEEGDDTGDEVKTPNETPSTSRRSSVRLQQLHETRGAPQMDAGRPYGKQKKRKRDSRKPKSEPTVLSEDEHVADKTKKAAKRRRTQEKKMPWELVQRRQPPITMNVDEVVKELKGQPMKVFTAKAIYVVTPRVQVQETLDLLQQIYKSVVESYVERPQNMDNKSWKGWETLPRMFDESKSEMHVTSLERFERQTQLWVQRTMAFRNFVIVDEDAEKEPKAKRGFIFEKELRELVHLNKVLDLQVQSAEVGSNADERIKQGTVGQLIHGAKHGGPILNALHLPRCLGHREKTGYTSDVHALDSLEGLTPISRSGTQNPIRNEDFRWAIAGMSGAFHGFHIDSDGLGTWVEPKCGSKWWVVASANSDDGDTEFAAMDAFLGSNFDLESVPKHWYLEAFFLLPGTRLVMRPNTPHAVYTGLNSVCDGGHFYSTLTLARSLYGLIHCFVAGRYISNTFHQSTRFVLREMLGFFHEGLIMGTIDKDDTAFAHLPEINKLEGRTSLISLCVFGILCNVLDFSTYDLLGSTSEALELWEEHDINGMPKFHRTHCMYTRAIALDIIDWLEWRYEGINWKECFQKSLSRIAGSLYVYMFQATDEGIGPMLPHLTTETLKTQLFNVFPKTNWLQRGIDMEIRRLTSGNCAMPSMDITEFCVDPGFSEDFPDTVKNPDPVKMRELPLGAEYQSVVDLKKDGESCQDKLYLAYRDNKLGDEEMDSEDMESEEGGSDMGEETDEDSE